MVQFLRTGLRFSVLALVAACTDAPTTPVNQAAAGNAAAPTGVWTPGPQTVARFTRDGNGTVAFDFRQNGTVVAKRVDGSEYPLSPGRVAADGARTWSGPMKLAEGAPVDYTLICPMPEAGTGRMACRTSVRYEDGSGRISNNPSIVLRPAGAVWPSS